MFMRSSSCLQKNYNEYNEKNRVTTGTSISGDGVVKHPWSVCYALRRRCQICGTEAGSHPSMHHASGSSHWSPFPSAIYGTSCEDRKYAERSKERSRTGSAPPGMRHTPLRLADIRLRRSNDLIKGTGVALVRAYRYRQEGQSSVLPRLRV
jgi:hypothetical protein